MYSKEFIDRMKAEIIADPDRFVVLDADAPRALLDQKRAGKKLLLITNSEWGYTDAMMLDYRGLVAEATGANIVRTAASAPLKQIAVNAGLEGGVVAEKVRNLPAGEGLNAATGEYVDMIKVGIIDPAKVTRSALQNAASIAKNILTTEAIVVEAPEKAAPAGGMPDMGGMGGMM